jgi:hypothetical protein
LRKIQVKSGGRWLIGGQAAGRAAARLIPVHRPER